MINWRRAFYIPVLTLSTLAAVPAAAGEDAPAFDSYHWKAVDPAAPWAPRGGLEAVELDGRFYIMGGRTPAPAPAPPAASKLHRDVWVSEDRGVTWRSLGDAPWPERVGFEAVTKGPYMYVMGGQSFEPACPVPGCLTDQQVPASTFYNDVYRSLDGVDWELMTDNAAWAPRAGLNAVVHRGWIYVFGGSSGDDEAIGGDGREFFTDVHKSRDGSDWIEVTDEAPWSGRAGAAAVVKDDRIFLLGGEQGFLLPASSEVWSSPDGAQWEFLVDDAWPSRSGHECAVLRQTIVCFGGFDLGGKPADVQISQDGRDWRGLDLAGPASPPWMAASPDAIKFDFDVFVSHIGNEWRGIYTFGSSRKILELPPESPGPSAEPTDLRADTAVWRFAPRSGNEDDSNAVPAPTAISRTQN